MIIICCVKREFLKIVRPYWRAWLCFSRPGWSSEVTSGYFSRMERSVSRLRIGHEQGREIGESIVGLGLLDRSRARGVGSIRVLG